MKMTDLRKAAEMALEALETHVPHVYKDRGYEPIQALRQALAMEKFSKVNQEIEEALKQPQQEPVAWVYNGILHEFDPSEFATSEVKPLYTAPPKREWVGLTDEELKVLCDEWQIIYGGYVRPFAETIEAKLKEKNT